MNELIEFRLNSSSESTIQEFFRACDEDFIPRLSERVAIDAYSQKIAGQSERFEAWSGNTLVGLVAAYCNDRENGIAYISSVSVLRAWIHRGIAKMLLSRCVEHAKAMQMKRIVLEVAKENAAAIGLYQKVGFLARAGETRFVTMDLFLATRPAR